MRPSLESLQEEYALGNQEPLRRLLVAFREIQRLPVNHYFSYYRIAGFHGYSINFPEKVEIPTNEVLFPYSFNICPHRTVIFPTWHRAMVLRIEQALQYFDSSVMMPYWDQISDQSQKNGIPWVLTQKKIKFGSETMENPLVAYTHPYSLKDPQDLSYEQKYKNSPTVRFPLCADLFNNTLDELKSYNKKFQNYEKNVGILNEYLTKYILADIDKLIKDCLKVSNYDSFSNEDSGSRSIELPHDFIHASVGSAQYFIPNRREAEKFSLATGDIANVPLAAYDPIFFFHHCFIDRVFWEWQVRHKATKILPMSGDKNYNLLTPLRPFTKNSSEFFTSADLADIQLLGYNYPIFEKTELNSNLRKSLRSAGPGNNWFSKKILQVSGIDRFKIKGSFVVEAYAKCNSKRYYLGSQAVFSRQDMRNCENCMKHLEVKMSFYMKNVLAAEEDDLEIYVKLRFRNGITFESLGIQPVFTLV